MSDASPPPRHTLLDDAQGLAAGVTLAAFGVTLLTSLGLVTGQTAGLAILLAHVTGLSFGAVFFAVNVPFYWLALRRMGRAFALRTFASVSALSVLSEIMPGWIAFERLQPVFGAVLIGLVTGVALLILFRHGASLGGVGILAVAIQDRTGFRAGLVQVIFDAGLFLLALLLFDLRVVALSALGALVLNLVIAVNHRRDHYIAF